MYRMVLIVIASCSDLSIHDIRRYVEKGLHLEKKALICYEEDLRKCVNVRYYLHLVFVGCNTFKVGTNSKRKCHKRRSCPFGS